MEYKCDDCKEPAWIADVMCKDYSMKKYLCRECYLEIQATRDAKFHKENINGNRT